MNPESPPAEVPKTSESVENTMGYDPCPVCKAIQNIESKFWIGCDECGLWYHDVCEGLTAPFNEETYICCSCRKKR